jgi:ATP-dependent protease ClpP protease subunit
MITFTKCTFVFALLLLVVRSAQAQPLDEAELTSRFYTDMAVDWSWELDCSESSDRYARQLCLFKAYPDVGVWIREDGVQVGSTIDKRYKENFDKILAVFARLTQDKSVFREPPHFVLEINSLGGTVAIALEIGRSVRSLHGEVRVNERAKCFSSCVFVLMGGETRRIRGEIGIHRPFLPVLDQNVSRAAIQKSMDQITTALHGYAKEMNVALRLVDDMLITPSEKVRILSQKELAEYGLVKVDPVALEARSLEEAKAWNLARIEYMRRKQKVQALCGWPFDDLCYRDVMAGRR